MAAQQIEGVLIGMFSQNIGQMVGMLNAEAAAHQETLNLLKALKRGDIELSRITITDDGWRVIPAPPTTEE